jgi:hypothetical protein
MKKAYVFVPYADCEDPSLIQLGTFFYYVRLTLRTKKDSLTVEASLIRVGAGKTTNP